MNTAIDELKENLTQKKKNGQHVIAVEYVLRKLKDYERMNSVLTSENAYISRCTD